jgi:hypothetical protein
VQDGKLSNAEHPLWYRGVSGTLDNQNYLVVQGSDSCPTDSKNNSLADDYINVNTVLHQNSGAAGGLYSNDTAQWVAADAEPSSEPPNASSKLPMLD